MVTDSEIRNARYAKLLRDVDDKIAACRAWGHPWPSRRLVPGKALPRGFRPALDRDGTVLITEYCERCGKERTKLFGSTIISADFDVSYKNPEHWPVIKQSEGASPRVFQAEIMRRMEDQIMSIARRNSQDDEDRSAADGKRRG